MRRWTLIVAFVSTASFALAQDAPAPAQDRQARPGGGPGRMGGGEGRMGFGGPRGGDWMQGMMQRAAEDLDLDNAQKTEFDRLAGPHLQKSKVNNERWAEVREAQDAGDEARARQIREQLMRSFNPNEALNEVLSELEPMLRPEQVERADAMRDRMQNDSDTRDRMRRIATELPDTLGLDETQRAQFEELLQKSREEMRNRFTAMQPSFEQIREARESGDNARARALQDEVDAKRGDTNSRYDEFFTQVEGLLRDDQKALLANFRDDLGLGGDALEKSGTTDVRAILQAAKRLKLSADQKKELKDIEEDAMKAYREAGRDKQARADLAHQVREELSKMLDESQQTRFVQLLERLDRKSQKR